MCEFTEKELELLSEGIIALMENTNTARKLLTDTASIEAIDKYWHKLRSLNDKVCGYMKN